MWHTTNGWGWWMGFGMLMMVAFWIIVIWVVASVARRPPDAPASGRPHREPTALEILEHRYASGEITDDEFERMRMRLADIPVPLGESDRGDR